MTKITIELGDSGHWPEAFVKALVNSERITMSERLREATAALFPKHVQVKHKDCDDSSCNLCRGGLFLCAICGGGEAALPAQCPGIRMTAIQLDLVQRGDLNFVGGKWVNKPKKVVVPLDDDGEVPQAMIEAMAKYGEKHGVARSGPGNNTFNWHDMVKEGLKAIHDKTV